MYLATLKITNFRKLKDVEITFQNGLNIIVGPNNIGKTAVVDALRSLLVGVDDPYPRFTTDDLHVSIGGVATGDIEFRYVFKDLTFEDEADFLHALQVGADGKTEAVLGVSFGDADKTGRLRARRWCGEHNDVLMTPTMLENLRSVYLPPLRDAELGLRPSRNSQLSRLLHLLSDDVGKKAIADALIDVDKKIKDLPPMKDAQNAIAGKHKTMLGEKLAQSLNVELSGSDFHKLAARLSILVDTREIERNGLGYNNLIYMAVVLSELTKNAEAAFCSLIVEEPEAHLHPQLQSVLLKYLNDIDSAPGDRPVQVFVTSHSPNFASIADLKSIVCLIDTGTDIEAFHPRSVKFEKGKREKLERYLDVTRAELFFARRIIFVEGAAEALLVNQFAQALNLDLRDHGVSLISVEGLNFDSFMPLYGDKAIKIPIAVITDADPEEIVGPDGKPAAHYPGAKDPITLSANTKGLKALEDDYIKVFCGQKTFEYDLALIPENRPTMLKALKDIHPLIGANLEVEVNAAPDDATKAKALFQGMFERGGASVKKGRYAQALAAAIDDDKLPIKVPEYLKFAIKHVCK